MKILLKVLKTPLSDLLLFAEAVILVYSAKFLLLILPFNVCARTTKLRNNNSSFDKAKLKDIKIAMRRTNYLIFWKNVCLVQSFAAYWMLNRRGISSRFHIGVNNDSNKKLIAHAWIMVDQFEVVPRGGDYLILKSY